MRPPIVRVHTDELVVDLFAGGGGASTGIEWALGRSPDIAINHDAEALAVHAANHPTTCHYQEDVFDVEPRLACGNRPVALVWFSADCTYHSKARGAKPFRDRNRARRRRGLAGVAVKWAEQVRPRVLVGENVEEFADWGPLDDEGRPDPARRGQSFARWIARLRNLGYVVEWRELRACDYGAPTTRKRLFIIARCDGQPIVWPTPTHGRGRLPYRTAAECIDWSIPCPSIFDRKRPLAEATLRRIARGIRRYVLEAARPFIVPLRGTGPDHTSVHDIDAPLSTVSAGGTHHGLVAPMLSPVKTWGGGGNDAVPADRPLRTITTSKRGEHAIVAATLINTRNGERQGQLPRVRDIRAPMPTVTALGSQGAIVAAFLAKHYGGHETPGSQLGLPIDTVTARDHHALVDVHLAEAARDHAADVYAFLLAYYGTDQNPQLGLPLATVTTKHRFGLVTVTVGGVDYVIVDIGMRMLEPRELFRAQGFGDGYVIDPVVEGAPLSKTAQVRLCGNSVCPPIAAALVRAQFAEQAQQEAVA